MAGIAAGLLNERLKVLEEVNVTSDFGDTTTEYHYKTCIRARHLDKAGDRTVINDEITYTNQKQFEVRFYADIKNTDIIEWYNNQYRIVNISPDRANQRKIVTVELIDE